MSCENKNFLSYGFLGQKWWQEKVAAEKAKTQASKPAPAPAGAKTPAVPAARGRGAPPARGKTRPAPAPQTARGSRAGAKAAPAPVRGRGAPAGRGAAAATRSGTKANVSTPSGNTHCEKPHQPPAAKTEEASKVSKLCCLLWLKNRFLNR